MSELAKQYYDDRAEELGIHRVPTVLNGEPIALMGEGEYFSIQDPERSPAFAAAASLMSNVLRDAAHYVMRSIPDDYAPEGQTINLTREPFNDSSNSYTKAAIPQLLIPPKVSAGKITTATIEAVAADDVLPGMLNRARKQADKLQVKEDDGGWQSGAEAYFHVESNALTGGRNVKCLGLVVVRATMHHSTSSIDRGWHTIGPIYRRAAANSNELGGLSARRDSAASARIVTGAELSRSALNLHNDRKMPWQQ